MCFSATASFVAAGFLLVTGVTAAFVSKSKSFYWLASVPLLFAVQQAFEGVVWITHPISHHPYLHYFGSHIFLFFALLVWPIWIPMVLFFVEKIGRRKKILSALMTLGFILVLFNVYQLTFYQDTMTLIDNHVRYGFGFPDINAGLNDLYLFIYACTTVLPFFIASLRWCKLYGVLLFVSLITTYVFMLEAFMSVWCFFAALLSLGVIFIIKANQ